LAKRKGPFPMTDEKPFVKYELAVVLSDSPHTGTLEVWASPEESPYVEWSLQTKTGYDSMGIPPAGAAQLADALSQVGLDSGIEGGIIIDGFDEDGPDAPASVHASWDSGGVDLIMNLPDRRPIRILMDDDNFEQVAQVVQALRECIATLVVDCTTHVELKVPAEEFNDDGLATLTLTGQRRGGQWSISAVGEIGVLGTVRIDLAATEDPDVAAATAKAWVDAECEHLGLKCVGYRGHNSEYGDAERPYFTTAQVVLADKDWE
jgi:hypothetical protein